MSDARVAVAAEALGKRFFIGTPRERSTIPRALHQWATTGSVRREHWALRDVSFTVDRGEVLGVIGANGAGKSTLLLLVARILHATEGSVKVFGKADPFFQLSAGLQPELSVLENFSVCSALLGMPKADFDRRLPEIIEFSGLDRYLYARYGELSTGLAARLPFSTAIHGDLDIVLADEMLSVGDAQFQAKCRGAFDGLLAQGKTLIVVSHNLEMVQAMCPRTLYLKEGRAAFLGETFEAVARFMEDVGTPDPGLRKARRTPQGVRETPVSAENARALERVIREQRAEITELNALLEAQKLARERETREAVDSVLLALGPGSEKTGQAADAAETEYEKACVAATRLYLERFGPAAAAQLCDSSFASIWLAVTALAEPSLDGRLRPGDEVITTLITLPGVAAALHANGLRPALVDIDPATFNMNAQAVEAAIGKKTRAVLVPHLAGGCAQIDQIAEMCRARGLWLIECNNGGLGGRLGERSLGSFGDVSTQGFWAVRRAEAWGVAAARSAEVARALARLVAPEGAAGGVLQDALGRLPAISRDGVAEAVRALAEAGAPGSLRGLGDAFAAAHARQPGRFLSPQVPAQARLQAQFFTVQIGESAPFDAAEFVRRANAAGIDARRFPEAGRWYSLPMWPEPPARLGALPASERLLARGVQIPASSDPERVAVLSAEACA
ncbi:MAG: DegT/DnrJ/EryC1/StrS family aminotransferase [Elusimicrobia bacterium]|nr:DegT/DnrJ/EryC1/StrS family aminotransferase [Elusimicrobiota bacterium]